MSKQLHVISTGQQRNEIFVKIVEHIHLYIDFIHLREPTWMGKELGEMVQTLVAKGVPSRKIIINDRVEVAHMTSSGGVQLAHHSMHVIKVKENFPHLHVGCSVHSIEEAIKKEKGGADFLVYGHIFPTKSKPGIPPRGTGKLQQLVKAVQVPVIAIGGITAERIPSIMATGASGIAVLSGILLANDPVQAAKHYRDVLHTFSK